MPDKLMHHPSPLRLLALGLTLYGAESVVAQEQPAAGERPTARRNCGSRSPTVEDRVRISRLLEGEEPGFGDDYGTVLVPVRFHVIHDGADGKVERTVLDQQIVLLNRVFASHRFRFHQLEPDWTDNPAWYRMASGSTEEKQARRALWKEPEKSLNFYIADVRKYAGWAQYPWDLEDFSLWDGVVVSSRYLPGGESPLDLGMTAVHEVGHWLGLLHTYEGWDENNAPHGGCGLGDEVGDTPHEASPAFGPGVGLDCPAAGTRDTCPADPGPDPIEDYMDTADDKCMTNFTAGQVERMRDQTSRFRTGLPVSHDCRPFGALSQASREHLLSNLRDGGFVIALRHGDKDPGGSDRLTSNGEDQAIIVGEALQQLGIPISKVFHSPRKRTKQTAKELPGPKKGKSYLAKKGGLRFLFSSLDETLLGDKNLVVVSHSDLLVEEGGVAVGCAEALVLDPNQPEGSRCLSRVLHSEWTGPAAPPRWEHPKCQGDALDVRGDQ